MVSGARRRATNFKVVLVAPLIVASLVIAGTYLGLYLGEVTGFSKELLAATMATLGFFIALPLMVRFIDAMVRKEAIVEKGEKERR